MTTFNKGDYVICNIDDFHSGSIWTVCEVLQFNVVCNNPFEFVYPRAYKGPPAVVFNPMLRGEKVLFKKEDVTPATDIIVKAKLLGAKVPIL